MRALFASGIVMIANSNGLEVLGYKRDLRFRTFKFRGFF